jgi:tetratricopeptide (TPR) repeat protein
MHFRIECSWPFGRNKNKNRELAEQHFDQAEPFITIHDHQKAIDHLSAGIELDQRSGLAHLCRGNAYLALGDRDRALEDYTMLVKLEPAVEYVEVARKMDPADRDEVEQAIVEYSNNSDL